MRHAFVVGLCQCCLLVGCGTSTVSSRTDSGEQPGDATSPDRDTRAGDAQVGDAQQVVDAQVVDAQVVDAQVVDARVDVQSTAGLTVTGPDADGYYTIAMPVSAWSAGADFGPSAELVLFDDFQRHGAGQPPVFTAPLVGAWDGYGSQGGGTDITDEGNGNLVFPIIKATGSATNLITSFSAKSSFLLSWNLKLPTHTMPRVATPYTYIRDTNAQYKSVWKMTWVTYQESAEGDNDWDGCFPTWTPGLVFGGNDFVNTWYTGQGRVLDFDDWSNWTVAMVSQADPLANQRIMMRNVSPAHGLSEASTNDRSFFSAGHSAQAFTDVRFPGWVGNGEGGYGQAWYDNIYIAVGENAFARIELGDAADYSGCTELWAIPFTSWTATEIVAKVHETSLPSGVIKYLYVHDKDQNVNSSGIPLAVN